MRGAHVFFRLQTMAWIQTSELAYEDYERALLDDGESLSPPPILSSPPSAPVETEAEREKEKEKEKEKERPTESYKANVSAMLSWFPKTPMEKTGGGKRREAKSSELNGSDGPDGSDGPLNLLAKVAAIEVAEATDVGLPIVQEYMRKRLDELYGH